MANFDRIAARLTSTLSDIATRDPSQPTPIQGPQTATFEQAITTVKNTEPQRVTFLLAYLRELWRLCEDANLNPVVLLAQAYHETGIPGAGPFESEAWIVNGNPAGIGITDGPNRSMTYETGEDAARAHVVHMAGYVQGNTGWVYDSPFKALDPQWEYLEEHPRFGEVRYVEDLGSGTWATQESSIYADAILDYMAQIEGAAQPVPPDQGTEDDPEIPAPTKAIMPDIIWVGSPNYHARGMPPIGIVHHITGDEVLQNTLSWFNNPESDASSTMVIDRDGTIYQCVSSLNAPWTNGDHKNPHMWVGYCQEMARRRVNWNNGSITYETVARSGDRVTEEQYRSIIALDQYFLHPDVYGDTIVNIRGFQLRHSDINSVTRAFDPGKDYQLGRIITETGGDPIAMTVDQARAA